MIPLKVRAKQAFGHLLGLFRDRSAADGTLTVLMYHAVTASPINDAGQMSVSAEQFKRQFNELAAAGVDVVDLVDGIESLTAGALKRPSAAIVFDDGFVGVHDYAADVLAERGWPATIFITTSWIGQRSMPLADESLGRPLTWRELETLHERQFAIGSHTHTHPVLARIMPAEIRTELTRSQQLIADHTGGLPTAFAYPFGAAGTFDSRTGQIVCEAGFRVACTTMCGRNTRATDPLAVKRIRVSWCDGPGEVRGDVRGCYDWYQWVQRAQAALGAGW